MQMSPKAQQLTIVFVVFGVEQGNLKLRVFSNW